MKHCSLRSRLIAWISIPILLATLIALISSYVVARHEIEEVYDAQLAHAAKVLMQLTAHEITEDDEFELGIEPPDLQHKYERNLGFRIWAHNALVAQSVNTKEFSGFEAMPGFSNQYINHNEWRFFVFIAPEHNIKIEVSERYDIRYELIFELMISLLLPSLITILVILLVVWVGVRQAMKPLVMISRDVDKRSSDDLSAIPQDDIPQEILPLISALNRLFERLSDSFKREREFTDHAAHELRTPLAAMKTQTQVLMKKAKGISDCAEGMENLQSSINRATHLVEQLLSLARLQHEELPQKEIDLSDLFEDALLQMESRAKNKNIKLHREIAKNCIIKAHADSIGILINNLLDNAIKYTPEGGTVSAVLTHDGDMVISDTGAGLSDIDKKKVFDRFVRADKTGQSGSGLGLSIAQWIARAHHVVIDLKDNQPRGLNVHIQWKALS